MVPVFEAAELSVCFCWLAEQVFFCFLYFRLQLNLQLFG